MSNAGAAGARIGLDTTEKTDSPANNVKEESTKDGDADDRQSTLDYTLKRSQAKGGRQRRPIHTGRC